MTRPTCIVLASGNEHKLAELQSLLAHLPIRLEPQSKWNISQAEETGTTFVENAILKARHACALSRLPAIADDSGLVVPSLGGEPGIFSSRYAGEPSDSAKNIKLLLDRLRCLPPQKSNRLAHFHATLVFLQHKGDPDPTMASGYWYGSIVEQPRGSNGFGYDPVFQPQGLSQTAAELDPEHKNQISHRSKATSEFIQLLQERLEI